MPLEKKGRMKWRVPRSVLYGHASNVKPNVNVNPKG